MAAATESKRVAVVGAGPAGLCAAKHCRDASFDCTVFEQSGYLGGTWLYTDCTRTDEYGAPIHTSMYSNLKTNLPKEVMMFPGIPYKNEKDSYLTSEEVLEYINDYADKFQLRSLCKFHHLVTKICRRESEWEMTVEDLQNKASCTYYFDILFICNGVNNTPFTAHIEGVEHFRGCSMHSHEYRKSESFLGQRVLVVGGGPSGMDLTEHISRCADKVFMSHHSKTIKNLRFRSNVEIKPDVRRLLEHSVEFTDDSVEDIDTLVYCTGFSKNYKFLDESCGITEDQGLVYPLYKHCINANHPSMCVLGNLVYSMQFPTFDIQVRFFMKTLSNNILPGHKEMLEDIKENMDRKLADGASKKAFFRTRTDEDRIYFNQLVELTKIEPIPRVLTNIHADAVVQLLQNFGQFRNNKYEIVDDENFLFYPATSV
ncbi:senecionine N-oxygenase-like isoform X1 [Homalodisca vitripennis]|uniref:senecionine N-oxygenase-like isoform X1 n=2 Tax=Homalodisca vitripennis TaxID=197043 RepID=UPI001EEB979C|nr:senecionine N-oxygenase-like isoform X1 [Homalodisca vitripennis]